MISSLLRTLSCSVPLAIVVSLGGLASTASAQTTGLPPGANTTNPGAPFFIDLTDLDFKTAPPTRNPANPMYPPASELPDGVLPPGGALGNYVIGPTHKPAPEATQQNAPKGRVVTFTMTSEESRIYNPGFVRDESVLDGAVNSAATVPGDPSN